jgi:SAM-dependent methyltransferase
LEHKERSKTAPHDAVRDHYQLAIDDRGALLARLRAAADALDGPVTPADLARIDQFHLGGLAATAEVARHVKIDANTRVLDAGSGLGGPSRFLAATFGCEVVGVDLAPDYVAVARMLTERAGLADRVSYEVGDLMHLPFADGPFDMVWTQHVVMNIRDRALLYRELRRVLKTGGTFVFYDPIAVDGAPEPFFPVPWAASPETSTLLTEAETVAALSASGFRMEMLRDVSTEALGWAASQQPQPPGPASLATVMGDRMAGMAANFARSIREQRVRLMIGVFAAV